MWAWLPLWPCPCVYPHIYFFLLINTLPVSLLSNFVGILFCTADGLGLCQWARAPVTRIQHSHFWNPTSISGQEKKPFFKPLQANATGDQNHKARKNALVSLVPIIQGEAFHGLQANSASQAVVHSSLGILGKSEFYRGLEGVTWEQAMFG